MIVTDTFLLYNLLTTLIHELPFNARSRFFLTLQKLPAHSVCLFPSNSSVCLDARVFSSGQISFEGPPLLQKKTCVLSQIGQGRTVMQTKKM